MTAPDRPDRTDRPRIAVVGAGWWSANHHVPSLAQHDGAELVAICDPEFAELMTPVAELSMIGLRTV